MPMRNKPEFVDPKEQPRNSLCQCGSGLKYKKCCGRPKKMDLTTYYKGRILDFQFNETTDKKEHDSMLKFVTELKESNLPLCLPKVKFDIKILEIDTDISSTELKLSGADFDGEGVYEENIVNSKPIDTKYIIQIKGEIL